MTKKKKISPESILEKFLSKSPDFKLLRSEITTSQLSDALKSLKNQNGVIHGIKPLINTKIIGRAVTVKTRADDWGTVVKAIDIAKRGDVIVICSKDHDHALWGELTSKTAQMKGIGGTIVHGAIRDVEAIRRLNYPVFYKNIVPNAGDPIADGEINVPINCGNIMVKPSDLVMGDDCGVVILPYEHIKEVINKTMDIKKTETEIISKLEKGISLSQILGLD